MPEVVFSSCPFNRHPARQKFTVHLKSPPPSLRVPCLYRHKLRLLAMMGVVGVNMAPARNSRRNDKIAAKICGEEWGGGGDPCLSYV